MFVSTFQHIYNNFISATNVSKFYLLKKNPTFLHMPPGDRPFTTVWRALIVWRTFLAITVQNVKSVARFEIHIHLREPFSTCTNIPAFAENLFITSAKFWSSSYTSLTQSFRPHYGPGFDSAFNRNEYQEYFQGSKSGRCVGLTTLLPSCTDCLEIWESQTPGTIRACPGLQWDCLSLTYTS
jgi:hypothetical protein